MSATRSLVIVESPAKARTIAAYLGDGYQVEASVGHIRDLPQPSELPADMKKGPYGKFGVNVDEGFDPYYVVDSDKKKKVTELRRYLKDADELILATDEDREGEAIAWHLLQVLKPKVPVKRMVFHEITPEAIEEAKAATRQVDDRLVDAQETRRILDRLVGYEVSPLLWRKVKAGISAGRVQSVATRLVVERERERMAFVAASYWDITAELKAPDTEPEFSARVTTVDGAKVATGRDFSDDGALSDKASSAGVLVLDEAQAQRIAAGLSEAGSRDAVAVSAVETKPYRRRPAAPFTTSTLQQEASRKLRMSARDAMRTAQSLYENGYITYMRTDSTALSGQAIAAARAQAAELFGSANVADKPRVYEKKSKGAQEAHEAIRPAGSTFRSPDELASQLSGAQLKLYDLIWRRTLASQMTDATGHTDTVRITADVEGVGDVEMSASGTVITHRGFLAVYEEGRDAKRNEKASDESVRLPELTRGQLLTVRDVTAECHTTNPPPRYTEASLVRALEERGIGRPSTYAATMSVIADRGYVFRRGQALIPTWLAFAVVRLLEENLSRLVDYDFTAEMESDLDEIAAGNRDRVQWLTDFYFGPGNDASGLKGLVEGLGDIDARAINSVDIAPGITLRVGRYGPYLEAEAPAEGGDPQRASVPEDIAPDELTEDKARELLAASADDGRELGVDPDTGHTIIAKNGRFGPYVTEVLPEPAEGEAKPKRKPKPKTASLFKTMDLSTVTLEDALKLMSLPRVVGKDAEGTEITAQNGRYGPYLKKGTDSRSLTSEDQIFTITEAEALEIYAQPKMRRGQTAKPPLRELGTDPATEKPVVIKDGRFGPYITDGTTNVTVPRAETVEGISAERAYELLAEKRAKGPAKRKAPARKKATAKKAPAKKTAAKKTTKKS
ncbi:type I DNA topoisomerase [Bowdeniella massiliensis]|uniref:type I DNA topoisomerase n=1 Tax=Bowdeniella massiliensis TaxID=2932264 RepID=UPI00202916C8